MTLRERIESYVESLGGEIDGFELSQDGLRAVLDAVLTETVIADAERDEYAEIGRLLDSMLLTGKHGGSGPTIEIWKHCSTLIFENPDIGYHVQRELLLGHAPTLLAALKSLKERCG